MSTNEQRFQPALKERLLNAARALQELHGEVHVDALRSARWLESRLVNTLEGFGLRSTRGLQSVRRSRVIVFDRFPRHLDLQELSETPLESGSSSSAPVLLRDLVSLEFRTGVRRLASSLSLTADQLQESILGDLSDLLSTGSYAVGDELSGFPMTKRSVLNYGVPSVYGLLSEHADVRKLAENLADAIRAFEPRVDPDTLVVECVRNSQENGERSLRFLIEGDFWGSPAPLRMRLMTEYDAESERIDVESIESVA